MSTVFVAPNGQFTAADPNLDIFGGSGVELVRLTPAATNADINPNVEGVDFSAPLSAFTFQVTGNVVVVRQGGVIIASVVVQDDANGTRFRFSDGGADLRISGLNQVTLGGVAVSTAAGGAPIASANMGANFDPNDPSSLGGQTDPQAPTVTDGQSFSLGENSPNGTAVGTVLATDPDTKAPGNTLTYSITAGNDSGAFAINSASGAITVSDASKLDFETSPSFSLTVKATDGTNLSDTATVAVTLSDANEAPTVKDAQNFAIANSSNNGAAVGTVLATDPDTTAPNKTLSYSITAGNTNSAFAIDSATGAITVADKTKLDPQNPIFNLTVKATDGGGLFDDASVTVTVTDTNKAPTVTDGQSFSIAENSANTTAVGTVLATDPNTGAPNNTLSYTITGGNASGAFAINSGTGAITVNDATKLDFETGPSFTLTVKASDGGNPALSDDATVAIILSDKNEAPKVNDGQSFSLQENSANSTVVGTVVATDPDTTAPNKTLAYSITAGNASGAFSIDAASGQIKVADTTKLDFDTSPAFVLTVKATDGGNPSLSDDATVTINLTDLNEAPKVADNQVFTANEGTPNNTVIGIVQASDPDGTAPNKTLSYSITSGNINNAFAINAGTGAVSVADSSKLDFGTTPVFNLTVKASDGGNPSLFDDSIVMVKLGDVNQAPTVTDGQSFSLKEHSATGTAVGTVIATDPDKAGTTNATLSYSITGGNPNSALKIDAASGTLSVNDGSKLDFETSGGQINLTVRATDGAGVFDESSVAIKLSDINEAPVLPDGKSFTINENAANGSTVGTIVAADPDTTAPNKTVVYNFSVNPNGAFSINGSTGAITVADSKQLDFENAPVILVAVTATDGGGLKDETTVSIKLNDLNDAPVLNDTTRKIAENSANGTVVGAAIVATDPDATSPNNTLSYAITGGDPDGVFSINSVSGQLTIANSAKLDFDTTPQFKLTVTATDGGNPALSDTGLVTVTLTDVNEAPTVKDGQSFGLSESAGLNTPVGTVVATDPDSTAPNKNLSFSITAGNGIGAFAINAAGLITVADPAQLNFETQSTYTLTVKATDGGNPALSDDSTVIITLIDANEAPTVTDGQSFSVIENAANGGAVGLVNATDPDGTSPNNKLSYSITAGNATGAFFIDPNTGQILVADNSKLDFEAAAPNFNLTVKATDGGGFSDTADVAIKVTDANEAPTVKDGQTASIDENSANGSAVLTVMASDPDTTAPNNTLSYSIVKGNTGTAFKIDANTGAITVANSSKLDFETTPNFNLTVRATDGGNPMLFDDATVAVALNNVNEAPVNTVPAGITVLESVQTALSGIAVADVDAGAAGVKTTLSIDVGSLAAVSGGGVTVTGTATALTLSGTTANINSFIAGGNAKYTSPANTAAAVLTVMTDDLGNTGSGGAKSDSDNVNITITPVNDAPVNTVPASISLTEDMSKVLTGISFADSDAGASNILVTLSVPSGALSPTPFAGVTFGGTPNALTLSGSVANINAFIAGNNLSYVPAADVNGTVVLNVLSNDLGNTGAGGSKTDSDNVNLLIAPVNDAPVLSDTTDPAPINELANASAQILGPITGNFVVKDVDVGDTLTPSLNSTIVNTGVIPPGGVSSVADVFFAAGAFTFPFPAGAITANGTDQMIGYKFDPGPVDLDYLPEGKNLVATYQVLVSDGKLTSVFQDVAFTVLGKNDAPVSAADPTLFLDENSVGAFYTVTATDKDVGDTLSFSIDPLAAGGTNEDPDDFVIDAKTGALSFKSPPNFEAPTDSDMNNGYRVRVLAKDSLGATDDTIVLVTVNNVNDPPVNTVPAAQSVNEDTNLTFSFGGNKIAVADLDDASLTVTLSVNKGVLTLFTAAGLSFTQGDGTADAAMTFSGTIGAINGALDGLIYKGNQDFNGADTLTLTSKDAAALTDTDTVAITVKAVNDAPALDLNGPAAGKNFAASFTENAAAVAIVDSAQLTVTDPDGMLVSATATITNLQDGAFESLSAVTKFTLITASYAAATGVLSLTGADTVTNYQAVLSTLKYNNTDDSPDTTARTITVFVNDGVVNSNTATSTVSVAAVNDPPTITNLSFTDTNFTFTATDGDSVALMSAGPLGAMAVNNNGMSTTQNVAAQGAITSGLYSVTDGMAGTPVLDLYLGTNGNNTISATAGPNPIAVYGFNGVDILNGTSGKDYLSGGAGNDTLDGSLGDDILDGGANDDTLNGGFGNDLLIGGDGIDTLNGGGDNDTLIGGNGDDKLNAGPGTNVIVGGAGNDTITAGLDPMDPNFSTNSGDDTIRFLAVMNITDQASNGSDTINNFGSGASGSPVDVIDLDALFDSLGLSNAQRAANDGFVVVASGPNTAQLFIDLNGDAVFDPNTQLSPVGFEYLAATINTPFGFSSAYPNGIVNPGTFP